MTLTAGVVAVQGDIAAHRQALEAARPEPVDVRSVRERGVVPECDLIALPGGESTTISRLLERTGIDEELIAHVGAGKPLLATCAGLIVAARDPRDERVQSLGLVDVAVERNAFGRQRDSFETELAVEGLESPFPAVFIRAPAVADVGGATTIASVGGRPVAVRDGPVLATAFHPELTGDPRIHRLVLEGVER